MLTNLFKYLFLFLAGILLNMSLVHLVNFNETRRHPIIAKSKTPKLSSTLWGLGYLFLGGLVLLLLNYRFTLSLETAFVFLGFSVWAIFLGLIAERADKAAQK